MKDYEINDATLAIIPETKMTSVVIEADYKYNVEGRPLKIIDYSCKYFGSSYIGRREGAKQILKTSYKLPIMVDDSRNVIFFPTVSPEENDCSWLALNRIETINPVKKRKDYTEVVFDNGKKLNIPISYKSMENQILRASRLESVIRNRKNQ